MRSALLLCAVMLAGCGATTSQIRIPLPVECREEVPERPQMPTEHLPQGSGLDAFIQAAIAEIERREGYEIKLLAALEACTKPLEPK